MEISGEETLRTYTALRLLGETWPGKLVLTLGLDDAGCSLAVAALATGAAVLSIERDVASVKRAMHAGCCDFAVHTLEEALRILKNEIRQKHPISVALLGAQEHLLPAMAHRGVLPDLLLASGASADLPHLRAAPFASPTALWGATSVHLSESEIDLQAKLLRRFGHLEIAAMAKLSVADRIALAVDLASDLQGEPELLHWTERWVEISPRLLPRGSGLAFWRTLRS